MLSGPARLALACASLGLAGLAAAQERQTADAAQAPQAAQSLAARINALAGGLCVDLLSGRVAPPVLVEQERFWASYGLQPGLPQAAMTALTPNGIGIVAQAILASGQASDGDFGVAVGGAQEQSCRIFVYGTPEGVDVTSAVVAALTTPEAGWRELSPPRSIPGVSRRSLLRRIDNNAVLMNSTTPLEQGPIAVVFFVAIVPPNVTLPEGF